MYKTLNRVLGHEEERCYPTNKKEETVANEMAQFFTGKVTKIRKNISENIQTLTEKPSTKNNVVYDDTSLQKYCNLACKDVSDLIKDMNDKSCSLDPMPTWLLKICVKELLPILTRIINSSINEYSFPTILKHAAITPIIKDPNGDTEAYNNYRPISNTAFLSKLLEKSVLSQLNNHIEFNKLHADFQSAYRKFHSCETATVIVVNDIKEHLAEGKLAALQFLDLSAAFDTIDHDILLERLMESYGIKDKALKWLESYLMNRTFNVNINGINSNRQKLKYGVPQGSLLGPLLFILYTKELTSIAESHNISIHIYADDTQLYLAFNSDIKSEAEENIDNCLRDIKIRMLKNFLILNSDLIYFGTKATFSKFGDIPCIRHDDNLLLPSPTVKSLGVYLDQHLTMADEISKRCSATYYHLRNMGRIKRCLDTSHRILLVQSLILSKLDYCNAVLANVPKYMI